MYRSFFCAIVASILVVNSATAKDAKELFNGKDLTGWEGDARVWSVENGAIVGHTKDVPLKNNTFLIWKDGKVSDFKLTLEFKLEGGNSGIQYRSKVIDPKEHIVGGYQADMDGANQYTGILYEERGRGILAKRGEKVVITDSEDPKKPKIEKVGEVGVSDEIQAAIHPADWNEYKIVAKGGHLEHFINGKQTVDVTDNTAVGAKTGILALQLHKGPTGMTVQFKDMVLKTE